MIQSWVIVALTMLLPQNPTVAQVTEWAWFRSVSTGTSWWTTDGKSRGQPRSRTVRGQAERDSA